MGKCKQRKRIATVVSQKPKRSRAQMEGAGVGIGVGVGVGVGVGDGAGLAIRRGSHGEVIPAIRQCCGTGTSMA